MIQKHNNPASSSDNQPSTAIYGLRPVMEAIDGGTRVDRILLQNGLTGNLVATLKHVYATKGSPTSLYPLRNSTALPVAITRVWWHSSHPSSSIVRFPSSPP